VTKAFRRPSGAGMAEIRGLKAAAGNLSVEATGTILASSLLAIFPVGVSGIDPDQQNLRWPLVGGEVLCGVLRQVAFRSAREWRELHVSNDFLAALGALDRPPMTASARLRGVSSARLRPRRDRHFLRSE